MRVLAHEAAEGFRRTFGGSPSLLATAPGRVNLIGEHTDYNEGFVMPAAIGLRVAIAARPCEAPSKLVSRELGTGALFDVRSLGPGSVQGWSAYPAGVAWAIRDAGFAEVPNLEAYVASELPLGSGLSSSAALELTFATVWNALLGTPFTPNELALLSQKAEMRFVGVRCGAMDQMASALGRSGHAMLLDMRWMTVTYVKVPEDLAIVVCDTGTSRSLADSAYNVRREECEAACAVLGIGSLRDADDSSLQAFAAQLGPVLLRRARHVVEENERCKRFSKALAERDIGSLGVLMRQSHESLRDDYEVSGPELDAMAAACWESPGCVGARMTGAGFGGSCVALALRDCEASFRRAASERYTAATGMTGRFLTCHPDVGAGLVSTS